MTTITEAFEKAAAHDAEIAVAVPAAKKQQAIDRRQEQRQHERAVEMNQASLWWRTIGDRFLLEMVVVSLGLLILL